jgi:RNA polymerase sigma-70 factor (ECF subfamily)
MASESALFESNRPALVGLAYRMLGDMARAEDIVQDAWVRWQDRQDEATSPRAYLATIVTRLCLNELQSARARREESRSDRLPEPVDLRRSALERLEVLDQVSMAFLVLLQRLTPGERAVLLLHDVFDFEHGEIAAMVKKSEAACRQTLHRARDAVARSRRSLTVPYEEQTRLLHAFLRAANDGKIDDLVELLADDAVFVADGGREGVRIGGVRNVGRPVRGRRRIAALVASLARRAPGGLERRACDLNGQPAIVAFLAGRPVFAVLLAVANGRIEQVFVHADPARLSHIGAQA